MPSPDRDGPAMQRCPDCQHVHLGDPCGVELVTYMGDTPVQEFCDCGYLEEDAPATNLASYGTLPQSVGDTRYEGDVLGNIIERGEAATQDAAGAVVELIELGGAK